MLLRAQAGPRLAEVQDGHGSHEESGGESCGAWRLGVVEGVPTTVEIAF